MEGTEKQATKSKRDLLVERYASQYPDKDYSDDEVLFGEIEDESLRRDEELNGYKEREKTFSDMFTSDPRSASFMNSWRNGEDPIVALVRQFGTDIKDAIDDPERLEEIAAAGKEFAERVAKEKELEEQYESNLRASLASIDELQASEGLTDDQVDAAMAMLLDIVKDGILGKFSPENIRMAMKAINHDADVTAANQEGIVAGKNTRVEEKLRKPKRGDGTAPIGGNSGSAGIQAPRRNLGALGNYGDERKNIWERGNERRISGR